MIRKPIVIAAVLTSVILVVFVACHQYREGFNAIGIALCGFLIGPLLLALLPTTAVTKTLTVGMLLGLLALSWVAGEEAFCPALMGLFFWTLPACRHLRRVAGRVAASKCAQCGYNLTGNTSGVCPECGEQV